MNTELSAQLQQMHESILRMGVLVEEALRKVLFALETRDYELAEEIVHADRRIDSMEVQIEDTCARIMATQRLKDKSLRDVFSTIKITTGLERIGDHARHIARRARVINDSQFVSTLPTIRSMTDNNIAMLQDFLTAYVESNPDQARRVAARDDEIDRLHSHLTGQLISIMRNNPQSIEDGMQLMLVARFLERFGDQITNMCEFVVYASNADHVQLNRAHE